MSAIPFEDPSQPQTQYRIMVDPTVLQRLEDKVDKITEALNKLVLVEERQTNQGIRIGELEKQLAILTAAQLASEKKIDQWINRGIGVWAAAGVVFAAVQFFKG